MWKSPEQPKIPAREANIRQGEFFLNLEEQDGGEVWQYVMWSTGKHSRNAFEECLSTWPREAIAKCREALNELEAKLENE